jgi:membrane-associated phospholipid phosphatase
LYSIIKKNTSFLIPYLLIGIFALVIIIVTSKSSLHLSINQFHNHFLDVLMPVITFFGNGLFACVLVLVLLLIRIKYSLYMFGSWAVSGLLVQLMKHLIFPGIMRPVPFLSAYDLHLVEGIRLLHSYSFPSGHAATAFAVFFIGSHITPSRILKLTMLILAILVAFSRIYLSLHFLEDVLAGSFIGIAVAVACIYHTDKIKKEWADRSLLNLSVKKSGNREID